ncbi:hypothetical protein JW992_14135 [candidate division KSB1 bacterium]|nr:hypothetical protein [candidate division KSB1 bacterium]
MTQIAIPVFEDRISNRLDCCEHFLLVTLERGKIKKRESIRLPQQDSLAKLKAMIDLGLDVVICNGITDFYSQRLLEKHIQVIPWISGNVDAVLTRYLHNRLISEKKLNNKKS